MVLVGASKAACRNHDFLNSLAYMNIYDRPDIIFAKCPKVMRQSKLDFTPPVESNT